MTYQTEQLRGILDAIACATSACGRASGAVRLIAVSKTFPVEDIRLVYDAGIRLFGENRVQELTEKHTQLPTDIQWHLIGPLQANKVRHAVKCASYLHGVDSVALIDRIDRIAGEEQRRPKILLEVNVSGEASKSGVSPEFLETVAARAVEGGNFDFCGLMTMAPLGADEAMLDFCFGTLRTLRDQLEQKFAVKLPELSMGMSGDFAAAIRNGATLVRIGTAIFGKR